MGELEDLVASVGVKQWVKNKFVGKLREFSDSEQKDVDKFIAEFNHEIFMDFKKVANETINEVMDKAKVLMEG